MARLLYENGLGPAVRIGILQHQEAIRISLRGPYRMETQGGCGSGSGTCDSEYRFTVEESMPAELRWRLVLLKAFSEKDADLAAFSDGGLDPLETIRLGYDFGDCASSVEYWRCSRPFASCEEAEAARARVPRSERVSLLPEVKKPATGSIRVSPSCVANYPIRFVPLDAGNCRVTIHDVVVGVGFHWQHCERQRFRGAVEIRIDNKGLLTAINEAPAEAYLFSVNSSEMMSVMPDELLKAQTVAARNTLFATMGKHHHADAFHLCADDHCQCYRGSSRETADSRRVTLATAGEVLAHEGAVCDTRYSKICGGIMEAFESVWNEDPRGYLPSGVDAETGSGAQALYPANTEERAAAFIAARPGCWCNTTGNDVPQYLAYSAPYYRWTVRYSRAEIEALISRHVGTDIGELRALVPLKRGASGRIEFLKIVTSRGDWTIGKELAIRKALSKTCLYSSAFVVEYERAGQDDKIGAIVLRGAGWGHGSGMCQVGATMMAYRGKNCREILAHYYPDTTLFATMAMPADAAQALAGKNESRASERCYEYFNCYAVARCPVYLEKVSLEAQCDGGEFVQAQDTDAINLEQRGIDCEFLVFSGAKAAPKG
ncbi:MAG: SpoIID/LytB domain-containing protein [Candidatus Sumerlaeota bacterium]|nr:SpoIID/LytB domain-containing protein [Candidatus Sumerlaeota bacterium]